MFQPWKTSNFTFKTQNHPHPHLPSKIITMLVWFPVMNMFTKWKTDMQRLCDALRWRHNEHDGVSNHQPYDLERLFRCSSKKTSKLRVTGLCEGNSTVAGEFPAQRASNVEFFFHLMTSSCLIWYSYMLQIAFRATGDRPKSRHSRQGRHLLYAIMIYLYM